ncbi:MULTISPECIES: hypothetical protein [unclassified Bradyrhizobium]|uniref:hypothetical protein n=1 Tax=unclassified Bradyrhizobium TaxID=2631580 RepID=UPI0028E69CF8|nr:MULTISPECIES: hypothetical protein [unclassified Bradyrhizobium]
MLGHLPTDVDPLQLDFESHKLLREAQGRYDHDGYIGDDIVVDPLPRPATPMLSCLVAARKDRTITTRRRGRDAGGVLNA